MRLDGGHEVRGAAVILALVALDDQRVVDLDAEEVEQRFKSGQLRAGRIGQIQHVAVVLEERLERNALVLGKIALGRGDDENIALLELVDIGDGNIVHNKVFSLDVVRQVRQIAAGRFLVTGEEIRILDFFRRDKGDGVGQLLFADEGLDVALVGRGIIAELVHIVLVDDAIARAVAVGDDDGVGGKAFLRELIGKGRVLHGIDHGDLDVIRCELAVVLEQVFNRGGFGTGLHQRIDIDGLIDRRDNLLGLRGNGVELIAGKIVGKAPDVVQGGHDHVQQDGDDDHRRNQQHGKGAVAEFFGAERGFFLLFVAHCLNPHSIFSSQWCRPSAAGKSLRS